MNEQDCFLDYHAYKLGKEFIQTRGQTDVVRSW